MSESRGAASTMVRRQLGRRLRALRETAGKTWDDVETAQIAGHSKLWRIETGRTSVRPGDVRELAAFYGASAEATEALVELARATKGGGWWEAYGVQNWLGLYADLEAASSAISLYHPELVPGLLQTEDYARAVTRADERLTAEEVERWVAFRMERQRAIRRPSGGVRLTAVLGAGALALRVGSEAVMDTQARHLRALAEEEGIGIWVLPWTAGPQPVMRGAFVILDFADPEDPSVMYGENLTTFRYVEAPATVAEYRWVFDRLLATAVPVKEYLAHEYRSDPVDQGQR